MVRIALILIACAAACADAFCQQAQELPSTRNKTYRGYYYFTSEEGDSTLMLVLSGVSVYPPERFADKDREQFYWRMVRDVRKGLPYAKLISATIIETYEYMSTLSTEKEKEEHMKMMEKEVFGQYKPELKKFSRQQARVLVKLVNRETNQVSYAIIKAFLGSFRAVFYQAFGRLFGVDLKAGWNPAGDPDDALIDRIATRIEQGTL